MNPFGKVDNNSSSRYHLNNGSIERTAVNTVVHGFLEDDPRVIISLLEVLLNHDTVGDILQDAAADDSPQEVRRGLYRSFARNCVINSAARSLTAVVEAAAAAGCSPVVISHVPTDDITINRETTDAIERLTSSGLLVVSDSA